MALFKVLESVCRLKSKKKSLTTSNLHISFWNLKQFPNQYLIKKYCDLLLLITWSGCTFVLSK